MTVADYEALSRRQAGVCAICSLPPPEDGPRRLQRLQVDHDHQAQSVRGLLCFNCNTMLGLARDDRTVLEAAIAYLARSRVWKS